MVKVYVLKYITTMNQSLLGYKLARYALYDSYKLNEVEINKDEFGKPYLVNYDIYFNISHSGDYVVACVDINSCGIDIERIKKRDFNNIAKKHFTVNEYKNLLNLNDDDKSSYFFEIWTCKEAYVKLNGKGIQYKLNTFNKDNNKIINDKGEILAYVKQYYIDDKYKLSVCSKLNDFDNEVIFVSDEQLDKRK